MLLVPEKHVTHACYSSYVLFSLFVIVSTARYRATGGILFYIRCFMDQVCLLLAAEAVCKCQPKYKMNDEVVVKITLECMTRQRYIFSRL